MTKDIRKAAQALINKMESAYCAADLVVGSRNQLAEAKEFNDLKAALKPSKSEVADWLVNYFGGDYDDEPMMHHAIEYLREDKDNG